MFESRRHDLDWPAVRVLDEEHVAQNVESDDNDNGDDDDDDEDGEWAEKSIDKATQRYIVGVIILLWKPSID